MTFVQSLNLIGCQGDIKVYFLKIVRIFSETERGKKLKLGIHALDISLYIICVFISVT